MASCPTLEDLVARDAALWKLAVAMMTRAAWRLIVAQRKGQRRSLNG